jgi:hypothetical protein
MDDVASLWGGIKSAVSTALNPLTPFRAAAAVVQNPFNPLKQTQAALNLFRGGSSPARPTGPATALPGGFGGAAPGGAFTPAFLPGGGGFRGSSLFPGIAPPPWPSSLPSMAPPSYYPPPPAPSSVLPPMYGPPMPADYGGQTGWDAAYGAGSGAPPPASDPWAGVDPMGAADQQYWTQYAQANPYG